MHALARQIFYFKDSKHLYKKNPSNQYQIKHLTQNGSQPISSHK